MNNYKRKVNTSEVLKRVIGYMIRYYKIPFVMVIVCIIITAIATVVGASFPQKLVDDYIEPMVLSGSKDFSGLLSDIKRLVLIMADGVISVFTYNRFMVNVGQGIMRNLRDDFFHYM